MKKLFFISLFILLFSCENLDHNIISSSLSTSEIKSNHLYGLKSGIITYKITINGSIKDTIISGEGIEKVYFDHWGKTMLKEEKITKAIKTKHFNSLKKEQIAIHNLKKIENNRVYIVDYHNKLINLSLNNNNTKNNVLKTLKGEKKDHEVINGYDCEIWTIKGTKQWLYKDIPLKKEQILKGIKTIKEAVSADFNVVIINTEIELPNYPIIKE